MEADPRFPAPGNQATLRMIVDEATIREITSSRVRRRSLTLEVHQGDLGETLRCPVRRDGVYKLTPCSRIEWKRRQAAQQPTRARAVLAFIDLIDGSVRTERMPSVTITVTDVLKLEGRWMVGFLLGDLSGQKDRAVFLAAQGDYTFEPARQAVPGDPEVMMPSEADMARARQKARESRSTPVTAAVRHIRDQTDTLAGAMLTMKAENRRKLIRKELDKLHNELEAA